MGAKHFQKLKYLTRRLVALVHLGALLLFFYKLRSKDVAIMAKYNAGEITREECDSQLSRKY